MKIQTPLFAPLPTPDEMRRWDAAATEHFGIPPVLLMENAGRAALSVLHERMLLPQQARILVVMGRGNNGGDGAALSRGLQDLGCRVLVCHLGPLEDMASPASEHILMAQRVGVAFLPMSGSPDLPPEWRDPDVIVDAAVGTGVRGDLRDRELEAVRFINGSGAFIFSLDIPSGLCGYTGIPKPEAVRADVTVTFEAGKPGLFFPEARPYTGEVEVRSIGMPLNLRGLVPPSWRLLAPRAGGWARPSAFLHKGTAGKALIVGGSAAMPGAPLLSAIGALRAGAGVAHIACPKEIVPQLRQGWPEIMAHGLGNGPDWTASAASELVAIMDSVAPDALVLGPGMGRSAASMSVVQAVLRQKNRPPTVVDADALSFFHLLPPHASGKEERLHLPLSLLHPRDIATPHPGEMANMLAGALQTHMADAPDSAVPSSRKKRGGNAPHTCINMVQKDRAGAVRAFTRACAAVLVLKGPGTLIGQNDAATALAPFAAPTLATAGSGDVLAGAIAAAVGLGFPAFEAASLGVYLHARAGELLAQRAPRGLLAHEIADALPLIWRELANGESRCLGHDVDILPTEK